MTERAVLGVVQLSESFHAVWSDVADELAVDVAFLEPTHPVPPGTLALIVAAGGEEDRALEMLPSLIPGDDVPLYLIGAEPSHRFAAEAILRGASDFLVLPGDLDLLRRTLGRVASAFQAGTRFDRPSDPFHTLLGKSPTLRGTLDLARRAARHGDVTILIQGETGTGKELLARALHDGSSRAGHPFVAVNCAAIPSQLLESELFGHERGAFTDAHATTPGLFEEADSGTLFLDEIGHLPVTLQGKLLRALDDKRIRRVGATKSKTVDVRIVAATHVDLAAATRQGTFREDLYYRLNVVSLTLPPLRDRRDDVPLLARAFAETLANRYGLPVPPVTPNVQTALQAHSWPGNVRELRHAIERALLLSEPGSLDPKFLVTPTPVAAPTSSGKIPFPAPLDEILLAAALATLEQHGGNKSAAARALQISRARLARLLEPGGGDA